VCGIKSREAPFGQLVEKPDLTAQQIKELKCNEDPPCGLVIIGTERHEARRIDRQLRGRSGRQGDPGQSVFYMSLEDDSCVSSAPIASRASWTAPAPKRRGHYAPVGHRRHRPGPEARGAPEFPGAQKLLQFDDVMNNSARSSTPAFVRARRRGGAEAEAHA